MLHQSFADVTYIIVFVIHKLLKVVPNCGLQLSGALEKR